MYRSHGVKQRRIIASMPKLWTETIEDHRREVHAAILDTAADLVARHGLAAVTMSQIAEETGIGRATLYKYFPDVEAILVAWHERHVNDHLSRLVEARDRHSDAGERLGAVLGTYALITHERARAHRGGTAGHSRGHDGRHSARWHARGGQAHPRAHRSKEISALVHRPEHVARVEQRLNDFMRELIADAAKTGDVRKDIPAAELASYCLSALAAAGELTTRTAVRRLVALTLDGLQPLR